MHFLKIKKCRLISEIGLLGVLLKLSHQAIPKSPDMLCIDGIILYTAVHIRIAMGDTETYVQTYYIGQ